MFFFLTFQYIISTGTLFQQTQGYADHFSLIKTKISVILKAAGLLSKEINVFHYCYIALVVFFVNLSRKSRNTFCNHKMMEEWWNDLKECRQVRCTDRYQASLLYSHTVCSRCEWVWHYVYMAVCNVLVSHLECILTSDPLDARIGSVSAVTLSRIKLLLKMNGWISMFLGCYLNKVSMFFKFTFHLLWTGILIFSRTCRLKNKPILACPQGEITLLHSWGRQWAWPT